jgi:hypothetical protein
VKEKGVPPDRLHAFTSPAKRYRPNSVKQKAIRILCVILNFEASEKSNETNFPGFHSRDPSEPMNLKNVSKPAMPRVNPIRIQSFR